MIGISRQAVNRHLQLLVEAGQIEKIGETRGARYRVTAGRSTEPIALKRSYPLTGLQEDEAFSEVSALANLRRALSPAAFAAFRYAFTEMANNAIEHSASERATVSVGVKGLVCGFTIRDFGVGVFRSIADKYSLADEPAAAAELLKGKRTTAPERHSGEGIFFTSKAGEEFVLRSHRIMVRFDNRRDDVFIGQQRMLKGTEVLFRIRRRAKRELRAIFDQYAPEHFGYRFERTRVFVKLYQSDYTARSEARRLLAGLDDFGEVILDFVDVRSIGQAFADEIFRVFASRHPDVALRTENLSPVLRTMIDHVIDN